MKKLILLLIVFSSCASQKQKIYITDLKKKNKIYAVDNNSYFYFMMDSLGKPHLVKTSMFNSEKIIWIEKLRNLQ